MEGEISCARRPLDTERKNRDGKRNRGRKRDGDRRMEDFGSRVKREGEKPVNMWYSNMAFSNVKHKKQSCRTCRTSVTQTLVSLCGFSVMYPPLSKERCRTLSFVTVFFFFLLCFYFFNSQFWLYSISCTLYIYGDALCTVHCTIFCVMSGLSPLGQPHLLTDSRHANITQMHTVDAQPQPFRRQHTANMKSWIRGKC